MDKTPFINIYPNPAQTGVNIDYTSETNGAIKIELKDLIGRVIYTNFISVGTNNQYIDLKEFNSGMYLITITRNKK